MPAAPQLSSALVGGLEELHQTAVYVQWVVCGKMSGSVFVCVCVCMFVCVCVFNRVCMRLRGCGCVYVHVSLCGCVHVRVHVCVRVCDANAKMFAIICT